MEKEKIENKVSRRQFFDEGIKGAAIAAYVVPTVLTVSLNRLAGAEEGGRSGQGGQGDGKGKGGNVSEVGGKGKEGKEGKEKK
jgi:hypothetical protein